MFPWSYSGLVDYWWFVHRRGVCMCMSWWKWWLVLSWCSPLLEGGSCLGEVLSPLAWMPHWWPYHSDLHFQIHRDHRGSPHSQGPPGPKEWDKSLSPSFLAHWSYIMVLSYPAGLGSINRGLLPTELFRRKAEIYVYVNISSRLPGTYSLSSVLVARLWFCRFKQLSKC